MKKKTKSRKTLRNAPSQAPPDKALERHYLTIKELQRLIALADKDLKNAALIRVIYAGALRREEPGMLILDYARGMPRTGRIYVHRGKGSQSGYVDLDKDTQWALIRWIEHAYKGKKRHKTNFIFPGTKGKGITGRTVYNIYNRLAKQLKFPRHLQHPHVLKRSRAQHMIEDMVGRGLDPWHALQAIAALIGHSSAKTTIEHYIAQSGNERQMAKDLTARLLRRKK